MQFFVLTLGALVYSTTVASAADDIIPDGQRTTASGEGVNEAWYGCATDRYRHAVLGDAIEGGCLIVRDSSGQVLSTTLPEHQVFEDVSPRIADIDADGLNDVVTVRSDLDSGAALVVYSITGNRLSELAATPTIGLKHRWLAPAGIADFNNDGQQDIAWVQTPHIGGVLRVWTMVDGKFEEFHRSGGYSNHRIGSSRVSTSLVKDLNNDGVADLALPDQSWSETVYITLYPTHTILGRKPYDASEFAD